eukprot:357319-Hanusia_phi.AAC.1
MAAGPEQAAAGGSDQILRGGRRRKEEEREGTVMKQRREWRGPSENDRRRRRRRRCAGGDGKQRFAFSVSLQTRFKALENLPAELQKVIEMATETAVECRAGQAGLRRTSAEGGKTRMRRQRCGVFERRGGRGAEGVGVN